MRARKRKGGGAPTRRLPRRGEAQVLWSPRILRAPGGVCSARREAQEGVAARGSVQPEAAPATEGERMPAASRGAALCPAREGAERRLPARRRKREGMIPRRGKKWEVTHAHEEMVGDPALFGDAHSRRQRGGGFRRAGGREPPAPRGTSQAAPCAAGRRTHRGRRGFHLAGRRTHRGRQAAAGRSGAAGRCGFYLAGRRAHRGRCGFYLAGRRAHRGRCGFYLAGRRAFRERCGFRSAGCGGCGPVGRARDRRHRPRGRRRTVSHRCRGRNGDAQHAGRHLRTV